MQNYSTFGEFVRSLREAKDLPIRKVAAFIDIDPSTLSKIERNERPANSYIIKKLAELFHVSSGELQIQFITDKIVSELVQAEQYEEILKLVESKIRYMRNRNQIQSELKF